MSAANRLIARPREHPWEARDRMRRASDLSRWFSAAQFEPAAPLGREGERLAMAQLVPGPLRGDSPDRHPEASLLEQLLDQPAG